MRGLITLICIFLISIISIFSVLGYGILREEFQKLVSDNPLVWNKTIESFKMDDEKNNIPEKAILIIGSSSIRFWSSLENDKTSFQVAENFVRLAEKIKTELPDTILYYLPITPTSARWEVWSKSNMANILIREYAQLELNIRFIHTAELFLDDKGEANKDLLFWDSVHLNKNGYAICSELILESFKRDL